jgi:hypothetical protein
LDKYFGINTVNPLIIKIDVELMERKVLYGMEQTLASGKVTHIILEISKYESAIFDILRKYDYNYCIETGFDGEKTTVENKTSYLTQSKYFSNLQYIEDQMKKHIGDKNTQKMLLFYRTPQPV